MKSQSRGEYTPGEARARSKATVPAAIQIGQTTGPLGSGLGNQTGNHYDANRIRSRLPDV